VNLGRGVEFRLLGPVEVYAGGQPVRLGRPQQRAVLAVLAVEAGRAVPADTLVDRIWDTMPPREVRGVLHSHVSRIRRVLTDIDPLVTLTRGSGGYLLDVPPEQVDLHRFRSLAGTADTAPDRAERLGQALALWRGEPLADIAGTWAEATRAAWRQQRLDAAVAWAQARLRAGYDHDQLDQLRALLAEHPLAEPLAGALMSALAAAAQNAEALGLYAGIRDRLRDELGAEPGPELESVHRTITAAAMPPPAQLPLGVRGFAGRRAALAALDALLDPPPEPPAGPGPPAAEQPAAEQPAGAPARIATLSGAAGIGKTALALHWAHRAAARFPDGQLYVNLRGFDPAGPAVEPAAALRRLLTALGVPPGQIPTDPAALAALYRAQLDGRRTLLVLDNARDADQVRPLLPAAPTVAVLVTSRSRLDGLPGAGPLALDLMSTGEARELLTSRLGAGAVDTEPIAVAAIIDSCARLPLALSIVAARARQSGFPLAVLAAELADAEGRLGALDAGEPATRVRSVFSWSYRALSPAAARLFRLLGLHPGPDISVPAAASLAGLDRDGTRVLLAELRAGALVTESAPARYERHDLLAAYAAELGQRTDPDRTRDEATLRLLDHCAHSAVAANDQLNQMRSRIPLPMADPAPGVVPEAPATEPAALDWLTREHPALLGALRLAADTGRHTHTWHLAWALHTFLQRRGHWQDWTIAWHAGLTAAGSLGDRAAAAYTHRALARAETLRGGYDRAREHLVVAHALYATVGDGLGQAHSRLASAMLSEREGDNAAALAAAREAHAHYLAAGHTVGQAAALNGIGWYEALLGRYTEALESCRRSLELAPMTDREAQAYTRHSIGYALHHLGRYAEAIASYQSALALFRELGDRRNEADLLDRLGDSQLAAGDGAAAAQAWRQALAIVADLGHPDADTIGAKLAGLAR
jgi:DNA-binding SARP family transcriptional activator/tetratricopeptide (TPR) repeat protein